MIPSTRWIGLNNNNELLLHIHTTSFSSSQGVANNKAKTEKHTLSSHPLLCYTSPVESVSPAPSALEGKNSPLPQILSAILDLQEN